MKTPEQIARQLNELHAVLTHTAGQIQTLQRSIQEKNYLAIDLRAMLAPMYFAAIHIYDLERLIEFAKDNEPKEFEHREEIKNWQRMIDNATEALRFAKQNC
jgi:hypothetical protein